MSKLKINQKISKHILPEWLDKLIINTLDQHFKISINETKVISESIVKLSRYYLENPLGKTPWEEPWCQLAHLCYFLPLNYLRNDSVFKKCQEVNPSFKSFRRLIDFGSGLSPTAWAFKELKELGEISNPNNNLNDNLNGNPHTCEILLMDHSKAPFALLNKMGLKYNQSALSHFNDSDFFKESLVTFSYSLTEFNENHFPPWIDRAENLLFIEPGTQDDGRRLLQLRKTLLAKGYSSLAPCTGDNECPLLLHSNSDWCHDRINIEMPEWYYEIEKFLPMKNSSLTFTYLYLSKTVTRFKNQNQEARIIGDPLYENGKIRQACCRNSDREFLSWLERDLAKKNNTDFFELPERGSLYSLSAVDNFELKGKQSQRELRIKN